MRIFYINLDHRPDRRAFMEAQFQRLGLDAERVVGMRLDEITDADRVPGYPWLGDGGIVCGLSHLRALAAFLDTGHPWALILEDDAVLSARLPQLLRIVDAGGVTADMVRVESGGTIFATSPQPIGAGLSLFKCFTATAGSAAYVVSRHAAEVLVAGKWLRRQFADVALFDPGQPVMRRLDVRQLGPGLAIQQWRIDRNPTVAASDLSPGRRKPLSVRAAIRKIDNFKREVHCQVIRAWQRQVRGATLHNAKFTAE